MLFKLGSHIYSSRSDYIKRQDPQANAIKALMHYILTMDFVTLNVRASLGSK
jgi:hypothetical protein